MEHAWLSVKQLDKHFAGKKALSSLSFSVQKGERIAIIGPSGAGKTTLLNTLTGIVQPDSGSIELDGCDLLSIQKPKARADMIGVMRQQFDLVPQLTAEANVLMGRLKEWGFLRSLVGLMRKTDRQLAADALRRVGLSAQGKQAAGDLSGGEMQRVALARLLVQNPRLILADEPVSSLDPAWREEILTTLVHLVSENKQTLIAILHSVEDATKYFDRILALKDGALLFDCPAGALTHDMVSALYQLEEAHHAVS